jgi:hypothetical protein
METEIIFLWVASIFIGMLIGVSKRQEASGAIWTLLLGPVGIIIVLCLPNRIKEQAAEEEKQRQLKLIQLQEEQLREIRALRNPPPAPRPAAPPSAVREPAIEEFIPENLRPRRR